MEVINKYLNYVSNVKKLSNNTYKAYERDIKAYVMWCKENSINVYEAKAKDIQCFIGSQLKSKSATTINRFISSVKSFYDFCVMSEFIKVNPVQAVERPRQPQKALDIITVDEKENIIEAASKPQNSENYKTFFRDYAIINLMFSTGLRRDEICNIKLCDVNLNDNSLLVAKGKGNKQRTAYYNDKTKAILSEYIMAHRQLYKMSAMSEYLFITEKSEIISDHTINNIVNKFMELANCKKKGRSCHNTRKRFATDIYIASKDIYAVSSLLGHSDISTAKRYAQAQETENKKLCMNL